MIRDWRLLVALYSIALYSCRAKKIRYNAYQNQNLKIHLWDPRIKNKIIQICWNVMLCGTMSCLQDQTLWCEARLRAEDSDCLDSSIPTK